MPGRTSDGGIRALFDRDEWESFARGECQQAGKIFKSVMLEQNSNLSLGANSTNHQQYAASKTLDEK